MRFPWICKKKRRYHLPSYPTTPKPIRSTFSCSDTSPFYKDTVYRNDRMNLDESNSDMSLTTTDDEVKYLRDMEPLKTERDGVDYYIGDDMYDEYVIDTLVEWYDKTELEKKNELDDDLDFYFAEKENKDIYNTSNLIMLACALTATISFNVILVAVVNSSVVRILS